MPITFEEVTGEIRPEPRGEAGAAPERTPETGRDELAEQLRVALQIEAERRARLCDA